MSKVKSEPALSKPTEPTKPLKFAKKHSLIAHHKKHVLDALEKENWVELDSGIHSKNGAKVYETIIEESALEIIAQCKNHIHTSKRELISQELYGVTLEIIYGWSPDKKIYFVLYRFVRNRDSLKYYIATGYRLGVKWSSKRFHLMVRRKIYAKSFSNGEKLLVDHVKNVFNGRKK